MAELVPVSVESFFSRPFLSVHYTALRSGLSWREA